MADIRVKPSGKLIGASATPSFVDARGLADGTQFGAHWLQRMAAEGHTYTFNAGTRSTPITGNGVYVATTPDLAVNIPAGILCIPTHLEIVYEAVGTSGIQEILALAGHGGTFPTTGTVVTPANHRGDLGDQSGLTARQVASVGVLPTLNVNEFFRHSVPQGITKTSQSATVSSIDPYRFEWDVVATNKWCYIYNPSSIGQIWVYMGGQAPTGFISLTVVVPPLP